MITPLISSYRKQQLVIIVTACGLATTIEILFTVIRIVARPSVQVPLSHSIVNVQIWKQLIRYFCCFYTSSKSSSSSSSSSRSFNYLLIVKFQPFNSVNSAMWQINDIFIALAGFWRRGQNPRRHDRNPRVIENMYGITRKNLESQEQGPQRIYG